jgi:ankyrin
VEAATPNAGSRPLHVAAYSGQCDAAVLLLDAGADVDAHIRSSYYTALHGAANAQSVKLCKLLLSRGASLDARDSKGRDPEAHARVCNKPIVADFLAGVRAAGGWSAYVAAPRNQLLALRRELPTRFRTAPCRERAQAQLFLDPRIPDDVFMHVLTFWRSPRDSAY